MAKTRVVKVDELLRKFNDTFDRFNALLVCYINENGELGIKPDDRAASDYYTLEVHEIEEPLLSMYKDGESREVSMKCRVCLNNTRGTCSLYKQDIHDAVKSCEYTPMRLVHK